MEPVVTHQTSWLDSTGVGLLHDHCAYHGSHAATFWDIVTPGGFPACVWRSDRGCIADCESYVAKHESCLLSRIVGFEMPCILTQHHGISNILSMLIYTAYLVHKPASVRVSNKGQKCPILLQLESVLEQSLLLPGKPGGLTVVQDSVQALNGD